MGLSYASLSFHLFIWYADSSPLITRISVLFIFFSVFEPLLLGLVFLLSSV
jgi:hypothetical protein